MHAFVYAFTSKMSKQCLLSKWVGAWIGFQLLLSICLLFGVLGALPVGKGHVSFIPVFPNNTRSQKLFELHSISCSLSLSLSFFFFLVRREDFFLCVCSRHTGRRVVMRPYKVWILVEMSSLERKWFGVWKVAAVTHPCTNVTARVWPGRSALKHLYRGQHLASIEWAISSLLRPVNWRVWLSLNLQSYPSPDCKDPPIHGSCLSLGPMKPLQTSLSSVCSESPYTALLAHTPSASHFVSMFSSYLRCGSLILE